VYSTGRYRPRFFLDQLKAGLVKFKNSNTKSIDHLYLGSIKQGKESYASSVARVAGSPVTGSNFFSDGNRPGADGRGAKPETA
jgi:hypothetical protein